MKLTLQYLRQYRNLKKNFKAVCKLIIQRFSFLDIGTTQNKSVYFHSAIVYEFISSFLSATSSSASLKLSINDPAAK